MSVLSHIAKLFSGDASASSPYITRNRCPHCNEHTPWQIAPLRHLTRCRKCNKNPLDLNE